MKEYGDNEILTRYLLGELNEEEKERVEGRYLGEREFFELLLEVEDDLIDAYALGNLKGAERERFEKHFLRSPARHNRVEFAEAWAAYLDRLPQTSPTEKSSENVFFNLFRNRAAMVPLAAMALLMIASAWLIVETAWLKNELGEISSERASLESRRQELERQIEEQTSRNRELERDLESERQRNQQIESRQTNPEIPFLLSSNTVRGSSVGKELVITAGAERVRLQAVLTEDLHSVYRAALKQVEGARVKSWSSLAAQGGKNGRYIVMTLPATALASGDYILTLTAVADSGATETVDEYSFRVVKK